MDPEKTHYMPIGKMILLMGIRAHVIGRNHSDKKYNLNIQKTQEY
jgi:hypothetical protein